MNNKNLARMIIVSLLVALNVVSCTAFGPSAVAKQTLSAMLQGDCEEVPQHITSKFLTTSGGETAVIDQCKSVYDKQIKSAGKEMESLKVVQTVSEDDGAMVVLQVHWKDGKTTIMTVMLEREDNQWKISTLF